MIFVDTWAWVALANRRDAYHAAAAAEHAALMAERRIYLTTDYVLGETISQLFPQIGSLAAERFVGSVFNAINAGTYRFVHISPAQFDAAWQMRLQYQDKPGISFVDLTSMVVMRELGIREVFTGDHHFEQVGLGFQLRPRP